MIVIAGQHHIMKMVYNLCFDIDKEDIVLTFILLKSNILKNDMDNENNIKSQ